MSDERLIEVRVADLKQLFNAMDPSPFREKDLDPEAEEFIVGWARELPRDAPLGLLVYVDRPTGLPEEPAVLRDASGCSSATGPRPRGGAYVSFSAWDAPAF